MFVSQVTFEIAKEQEDLLKKIMKNKQESAKSAEGAVSAECWYSEKPQTVAYTLVVKWNAQENFRAWMAQEHKPGHHTEKPANRPNITRTGAQYETIEL